MSLVFDALKLSKTLGRAFTQEQAEVLTEAFSVNLIESLATKSDLVVLQAKLEAKIDSKIDALRAELKTDLSAFRTETIRWIVGAIAFNLLATAGLMIAIAKLVAQK